MAFFRITLLRSAIGLPEKSSRVLAALGLRKRLATVYQPVTPSTAGQVFAVKELVDVEEVDMALSKQQIKELRRPERGFYVESRAKDARQML
ncbi:related to ribosomal protein L30 [Ramularia collo-cygni]|uniref:Large ribosomal subunit protein uL30m n=1 Tax=Ramularia collo-cygni TaxID=112498 RepID=A0A2D3VR48_9PEZI|nr:related to ribosomal protein L30 [Ramularia collo-cygni]CZT24748.1 related to ribosomal protein L30 [Ramularia collo-cygni]